VGLYQHDVKAKHLRDSLDGVVESCVNFVGVDVNTASPSLLRYVSGLNQLTARRIYEYRTQHGPFTNRDQIRQVPGIGDASFVQSAGFLKINAGENPLDATWIHPESYPLALKLLEKLGSSLEELVPKATPVAPVPVAPAATESPSLPHDHSPGEAPAHAEVAERTEAAEEGHAEHPMAEPHAEDGAASVEQAEVVSQPDLPDAEPAPAEAAAPAPVEPPAAPAVSPIAAALAPIPITSPPEPAPLVAVREKLTEAAKSLDIAALANEWGVGEWTLRDVLAGLTRQGRDPREDLPPPIFRRGILKLDDLAPEMELSGTVLNVVDFGAFVDVGLGDSGLVHISRLADRYISDPHEVVSVGDVLRVWVVSVDKERRRVSLTAIPPGTQKPHPPRREKGERPPRGERPAGRPAGQGGQGGGRPPRGGGRPAGQGAPVGAATGDAPSTGGRSSGPPGQGGRGKGPPPGRGGPRGGSGGGGGGRGGRTEGPSKPYVSKPKPAPPKPITKAMELGKEPMRTFGDLMQFIQKKDPKAKPPQNPPTDTPPPAPPAGDTPPPSPPENPPTA